MPKLEVYPTDNQGAHIFNAFPEPASNTIPEWYKKMPTRVRNAKEDSLYEEYPVSNLTLKGCVPFLDAMTAGYTLSLPCDVQFKKLQKSIYEVRWKPGIDLVNEHAADQFPGLPAEYSSEAESALKWLVRYQIKAPKGYSLLFTHPINRHDLPFRTFTGFVDADDYPVAVQFPFQISENVKDFFIIEKGTPIVQIIPIKREPWKLERKKFDELEIEKTNFILNSGISRVYKKIWWKKKSYK